MNKNFIINKTLNSKEEFNKIKDIVLNQGVLKSDIQNYNEMNYNFNVPAIKVSFEDQIITVMTDGDKNHLFEVKLYNNRTLETYLIMFVGFVYILNSIPR